MARREGIFQQSQVQNPLVFVLEIGNIEPMAEVANLSIVDVALGATRNLLHDIAEAEPADCVGLSVRSGVQGEVCTLTQSFAVAEPAQLYGLGGICRWEAEGIDVEIEMISWPDKVRSVIYVGGERPLHVFTPPGTYRFRYRVLSAPGTFRTTLTVTREGHWQRLGLYAVKAWQLLRRGPRALLSAAALMRSSQDSVVATRTTPRAFGAAAVLPPRAPVIEPKAESLPSVTIIIPTRDRVDMLEPCIASLKPLESMAVDIIIVDNGTVEARTLAYLAHLAAQPHIRVLRCDIPFNFSRLCNAGAAEAMGETLLFLNDDIEALDGEWLGHMLAWLSDPAVGTVGARLLYPSHDLQHAGIASNLVPGPGHPWRGATPDIWQPHPIAATAGEVDAVTGACLLVRRADFEAVGGFNETAFAITLNDVDLCLKLRQRGQKSIYVPEATLIHKEGQSRADDYDPAQRARRRKELKAFFELYPDFARISCFYPEALRRDSDQGLPF
jgi:GT2 family glycosyltransferase